MFFLQFCTEKVTQVEWNMQEMSGGMWLHVAIGHLTQSRSWEKSISGRSLHWYKNDFLQLVFSRCIGYQSGCTRKDIRMRALQHTNK